MIAIIGPRMRGTHTIVCLLLAIDAAIASATTSGVVEKGAGWSPVVIFDRTTTTAALRNQATDITASTSGGVLTVTALTTAPSSGDTFVIV